MFYSHQLLARKAPLGQIWMAATMHAKMNRRKLDQIDIIRICEEILNPSVPMALRLSGILMGGVVIVYERKVRLLHDDVNRFLLEINSAWKVKPAVDHTVLPKGKNQAKFEAVTLPENHDNVGDIEQSLDSSNKVASSMGFQQTAYIAMRLDTIDELTESFKEKEPDQQHHQVDAATITLDDPFDSYQVGSGLYNRFERFDIEGDEETTLFNIPSQEQNIPPPNAHSPPPAMEPQTDYNTRDFSRVDDVHNPEKQYDESSPQLKDGEKQQQLSAQKQNQARRKIRRKAHFIMDNEQTMIPSNLYQSWLQNAADICSSRPKVGEDSDLKPTAKIAKLMNLPPVAICCGLIGKNNEVHYPMPLLKLWMTSTQPPHDSPSARTSSPRAPEPSSSSPPSGQGYHDPPEIPMGDFGTGVAAGDFGTGVATEGMSSREIIRRQERRTTENPIPNFDGVLSAGGTTNNLMASGNGSDKSVRSVPSPTHGDDVFVNTSDNNSGRLNKRRASSRLTDTGLEALDEENPWFEAGEPNFEVRNSKMPRRSNYGPTPDHEILVETGTTQTQRPVIDEEAEIRTNNIATQLKTYFETTGAPQTESLNQLALGMVRKQAAQLFYQTCVLATRDVLKVKQTLAYGDIILSRGAKM
ncbi:sister chromatid cohesion 1 protein 1 [Silene latifolia]|uniref:sister chromatid cohesion 1 protein 1 n=1 Tax=Silene latifolia TaxID=37657 RepID=UPI003D77AEF9